MNEVPQLLTAREKLKRLLLKWLIFVGLGVFSYGVGLWIGHQGYEANLIKEFSAISNNPNSTQPLKSSTESPSPKGPSNR